MKKEEKPAGKRKTGRVLLPIALIAIGILAYFLFPNADRLFLLLFWLFCMVVMLALQRQIRRQSCMDPVTGTWNRPYFQASCEKMLSERRNRRKAYAVVVLKLERYANYCACHGVQEGEELLESIAAFLKVRIERDELCARYEGDGFCLFLHCTDEENCRKRLCSLLAELSGLKPERRLHFHAGVCLLLPNARDGHDYADRWSVGQLCHYANVARMSLDKEREHKEEEQIAFFDHAMLEEQIRRQRIEEYMEEALHADEFEVYLQPKYNPVTEKLIGAEALVRWNRPGVGLIPPGKFIPVFEENGFITQLDDYMIAQVARLQAEWTIQKKKLVTVSVNISRAHFTQDGLVDHICQLVDAYGARHDLIELEVTESAFLEDKEILIETVKQLKAYGFKVSMDDFGSGYSSLNSLKDMPLDVLKLDMEFFRGEGSLERGEIIVREAIRLAKSLKMRVVAEGIERKEQVEFLAGLGCDMIQGYYFAKPLPVDEFERRVERDA